MSARVIVEKDAGVGRITLNQPEKMNAIAYDMWRAVTAALADFATDGAVRVVVLRGAGGKAFSAGADISEFEAQRGDKNAVDRYNATTDDTYFALVDIEKPTIAHIEGYCMGGGLGLALGCDLRLASDDARFGIPAARLGLGYTFDYVRPLVQLVGPSTTKEILYTAKRFAAPEAMAMGLVNRIAPRAELDALVDDYVSTIAGNAPLTIRATKAIVAEVVKDGEADLMRCDRVVRECYKSDDYEEGRRAFMEKRAPVFRGR